MGTSKDNQKTTVERKQGLVDRVKNLLPKKESKKKVDKDTPKTFLDFMEKGDELMTSMPSQ